MKLIMFDLDGTLFRTETSFFPSVREFASRHAFPVPEEAFLRSFIGQSGSEWRAWLEQLQLGQSTEELASEFDLLEREYVRTQGELYEGAADVLRSLSLDGWKLGVCSNAPEWYPEMILARAGVRDLFMVVRVPSRPDQTKSMMLCEVWNEFRPERCAMVGDRADDMRAAYAGGYFAIGAVYGWAPQELEFADVRIHDIAEVPAALVYHWSHMGGVSSTSIPAVAKPAPVVSPAPAAASPPTPPPVVVSPAPTPPPPVAETPASRPLVLESPPVEPMISVLLPEETPSKMIEEPPATAPVVVPPVEPVFTPPAPVAPPLRTPEVVVPRPVEPEPPVPARRSWNPFRRHEDKPR